MNLVYDKTDSGLNGFHRSTSLEVTATYKYARCKMPCHTCMVSLNDLNNMDLSPENMPFRIHGNIQEIVKNRQGKEFSVHSVENAFWKFP